MFDRSLGHVGLCLVLLGWGLYLPVTYGAAIRSGTTVVDGQATQPWVGTLSILAALTGVAGVAAAVGVWGRWAPGRRLGFTFVLGWVLVEGVAIWGWLEGPRVALAVVRDPMAPVVRLWVAISIGLYIWAWAGAYVECSPTLE
ncbi:hypothetical protein [Halovivax cerinus]|uniref:Uncharacterized protein n=1 Tax=Halovivax cerinus TaxID=1487865 RepID=A0ABD5NJS5_9EURY|nr:hypothetical protein [Halovivax cerinus]